jgi:hypothetical protein
MDTHIRRLERGWWASPHEFHGVVVDSGGYVVYHVARIGVSVDVTHGGDCGRKLAW